MTLPDGFTTLASPVSSLTGLFPLARDYADGRVGDDEHPQIPRLLFVLRNLVDSANYMLESLHRGYRPIEPRSGVNA